jgi:hypothetical protein
MGKVTDFDELYPARFLKAGELKGNKVTLTIADVDTDELQDDDGKKKIKGFLTFEKTPKQVVLNKTNGLCLKAMFGRKVQEWVGKRVIFFPDKWNGEECIRIWGSPDIPEEMDVEVKLPRKKPINMRMHKAV